MDQEKNIGAGAIRDDYSAYQHVWPLGSAPLQRYKWTCTLNGPPQALNRVNYYYVLMYYLVQHAPAARKAVWWLVHRASA